MYIVLQTDCELRSTPDPLDNMLKVQAGYIVIQMDYIIAIPLGQCTTAQEVYKWTNMLRKMKWMENDVIERFRELACEENGLPMLI